MVPPATTHTSYLQAVFNCLVLPAISGLFYVRLIAIYNRNKTAIVFFGTAWIGVFTYFIYESWRVMLQFASIDLLASGLDPFCAYLFIILYDTMIHLAISWQLAAFSIKGDGWRHRVRSFVAGDGLPELTKALLRSGQIYYL